jgi:histone H3/H4
MLQEYKNAEATFDKRIVNQLARRGAVRRFETDVIEYTKKVGVDFLQNILYRAYQYQDYMKLSILNVICVNLGLKSSKFNIQMVAGSQDLGFKGKLNKMSGAGYGDTRSSAGEMRGGAGGGTNLEIEVQMRQLQKSTHTLIPKAPLERLIKEIIKEYVGKESPKIRPETFGALHAALEGYLVKLFTDAQILSLHAKRKMLFASDMAAVRVMRGEIFRMDIGAPAPVRPQAKSAAPVHRPQAKSAGPAPARPQAKSAPKPASPRAKVPARVVVPLDVAAFLERAKINGYNTLTTEQLRAVVKSVPEIRVTKKGKSATRHELIVALSHHMPVGALNIV